MTEGVGQRGLTPDHRGREGGGGGEGEEGGEGGMVDVERYATCTYFVAVEETFELCVVCVCTCRKVATASSMD